MSDVENVMMGVWLLQNTPSLGTLLILMFLGLAIYYLRKLAKQGRYR